MNMQWVITWTFFINFKNKVFNNQLNFNYFKII